MPRVRSTKRHIGGRSRPYKKRRRVGTMVTRDLNLYSPPVVPLMYGINTGFPQQIKVRLRYVDEYVMTSTAGSTVTQTFRMNSIFDPDFTGVGHQPYGHDQWSPLYTTYVVLGSKLKATWSPLTEDDVATSRGPWNVLTVGDDDGSVPGSALASCELPRCDNKVLGSKVGGNNIKVTSLTYSPVRDLGLDPFDDTVGAAVGSNPSRIYFGSCQSNDANSTTSSVMLKVEMEFLVLFRGSKNQAQS